MKLNVVVRTDGDRLIRKKFEAIRRAPDEALRKLGDHEVQETKNRIISGKNTPEGQPWAAWSLATLRTRQRDGTASRGLLYRTGALLNSITHRISNKTLTIFSNIGYARFLQVGTMKMPARPFLGWSRDSLNKLKDLMGRSIND